MRTETVNIYKIEDLNEEQFETAHREYRESSFEIHWQSEILESFQAVIKACGYKSRDWGIGANYHCYIRLNKTDCDDLSGPRAFAWLENQVLSPLRISFAGERRWKLAKYGKYYRPGMVSPCPFTGYCADDDLLDDLKDSIRSGMVIRDAVMALADKAGRILQGEYEDQMSEDYFRDMAEANGWEFYEDGEMV